MTGLALLLVAAALAAVGWLLYEFTFAPVMDFDEHTRTALALLTPDDPALPDDTPFADQVEPGWPLTPGSPDDRPVHPRRHPGRGRAVGVRRRPLPGPQHR